MEDPLPSSSTHHIPAQHNFTEKSNSLVLPKQLENIKASTEFPQFRHRWNTNEEIASVLISFSRHKEWMHLEMKVRPPSGSMILYSRNKVRYRKDGYCWKKRKDGKNIREDHMKLKVQGLECIYGSYVHSDILPTFHRRCYWLLQNPDIVLVHYLNVPYPDNTKVKIPVMPPCTVEKKEWTKEELVDQLRPMFSTGQPGEESEQMIDERVEALVKHLIEYHENRDKFTKQKCEKFCDKRCSHSSIVKIPHHGHSSVVIDTSQFTHSQCSAKLPCKAAQTRTTSSLQQTKRNVPEHGSCNTGSTGSGMIVHHKGDELSCSTDLAQVPYILNLAGHIHVPTSSYLIVNGQTNPISTSAALETNCQPHCQSSTPNIVLAHQTQGLNFSAVKLEHNSATTLQPSELQHEVLQQQQKLLMQNSHLQKPVTDCADLSPVEQLVSDSKQVCVPMQLSCDESLTNLDDNAKCDKINLVPYLKTVTADDVQEVVQSHPSSNTKDKSKGDLNVLENDSLSASLGSSDFDHLDLDLPDLDKLYSFLGSGSDVQTSSEEVILHDAGQIQSVNCVQSRPELCDNEKCSGQLQHCQGQLHFQGEGHLQGQCCLQPLTYGNQDTKSVLVNSGKGVVCNRSSQTSEDSLGAVRNGNPASDHGNQTLMDIVDFSPEWSYVEGGSKLLVIGPWYRTSSKYTCVIDDIPVQTTYVQPGVLRCYTPAHTSGYVSLQVSCDGVVISDSKTFEYKKRAEDSGSKIDWFSCDEHELKLLLIDKLIELEGRLMESQYRDGPVPSIKQAGQDLAYSDDLQGKLSWYVKMFSAGTWKDVDTFLIANRYNMTLLHLSAALGYARLIHALIQWRNDNPCMILDYEVDGSCQDNQSYTPMMWACAKGNLQAAVTLYHWNSDTLNIPNKDGVIPLDLAQSNGHFALHDELVKLQQSNSNSYIFSGEPYVAAGSVTAPNSFPDTPSKVLNLPFCTSTPHSDQDKNLFKSPHPLSSSKDNGCLGMLHIDIPSSSVFSNSGGRKSLVRRQSDQTLPVNAARRKLSKRFSVDLPSATDNARSSRAGSCDRPIREANSEPHLSMVSVHPMTRGDNPMLSDHGRDITSPDILMHTDSVDPGKMTLDHLVDMNLNLSSTMTSNAGLIKMETDDLLSSASGSPLIDVENVSSDDDNLDQHGGHSRSDRQSISTDNSDEAKQQMVTLAKQIIAAMPERIKSSPSRGDDLVVEQTRERSGSYSSVPSQPSPHASSYEEDSGISTRMVDGLAFDEYRYPDISTPASSLSPDSTCLPSPYSPYSFTLDSPPPTTEDFTEYFNAPATFMEKDFSQLTLSDQEQRKLYEAAKVIQKTYRLYRDKQQLQQQQQKEIEAAVLIQKYYRRYKQYAYYKKMTQAAVLIQSQFRSYYAQKRFKKSRDAAVVIQNQYRTYKEHERRKKGGNKSVIIQQRYRSHYQRKNMKGQSADGHIVQIVPESTDSSPPDQSSTCTEPTKHQDDERAPSSAVEEQQGE